MKIGLIIGIFILTVVALLPAIIPLIKRKSIYTAIAISILLPVISVSLYFYWCNPKDLLTYAAEKQRATQVKAELAKIKNPQQVITQLKNYLTTHPQSPKGWYLLGKIYLSQNHYQEALVALTNAHNQDPNNIEYTTVYVMATFFTNKKQLTLPNKQLLIQVINQTPNNVAALNLLAIDAYNRREYKTAIQYWEKLIPLFDPQSEDEKILLQMISQAQKKLMK